MASSFLRFLDHTQRRTTVGRTPLDEWSARRRDLYLTTYNTHNRQTSIGLLWTSDQLVAETSTWQHTTLTTDKHPCPPVVFEPTISADERPQNYALDRAAAGDWRLSVYWTEISREELLYRRPLRYSLHTSHARLQMWALWKALHAEFTKAGFGIPNLSYTHPSEKHGLPCAESHEMRRRRTRSAEL